MLLFHLISKNSKSTFIFVWIFRGKKVKSYCCRRNLSVYFHCLRSWVVRKCFLESYNIEFVLGYVLRPLRCIFDVRSLTWRHFPRIFVGTHRVARATRTSPWAGTRTVLKYSKISLKNNFGGLNCQHIFKTTTYTIWNLVPSLRTKSEAWSLA